MANPERFHIQVSHNGRLVLPKPLRQTLGIVSGGRLVAERKESGEVVLLAFASQIDAVRDLLRPREEESDD